ncbi:MAG: bifunctional riboflavin kinase/FAD synthetase [Faecousia sp.]
MNNYRKIFALGFFDGVHLGHQALLAECVRLAKARNARAAAITFETSPLSLLSDNPPPLINSARDRQTLLRRYGMDAVFQLPVTREVMSTPWDAFLENLVEQGAAGFVCGHDFRFGNRGAGDTNALRRFCSERELPCVIVPEQTLDGIRVSSTHIRQLLEAGETETAVRFLGHPHLLSGCVTSGQHLGRKLGIPTANLHPEPGLLVPKFGVYACRALVDGKAYCAVTNIGTRPTVAGTGVTVEPWILDFEGDLYGKEITLEFHAFLRPERKFDSLAQLQEEIRKNALQTRKFFGKT